MPNIDEIYFQEAAKEAKLATCHRAKCGCVIVAADKSIIGRGHNSPPGDDEAQRTCDIADYDFSVKPKYDKTCCVHAEWKAILDACKRRGKAIEGSTLYFMRINDKGEFTNADAPYCTVCSRLTLESGVKWFVLWNGAPQVYDTSKYNKLSYDFHRGV